MSKQFIIGLDSLRFICFIVIFANHATSWFPYGYLAVDFFFTLSAFLLTLLALNEISRTGTVNRKNFFLRRMFRIWPLYYFVIGFSFFILPWIIHQFGLSLSLPSKKIYYWLFISNYYYEQHHFALKQLWSIAVEEQFYLLFLILSLFLKNHAWKVVIVLSAVYPALLIYRETHDINLYTNTLYHLVSFATGMAVAKIVTGRSHPPIWLTAIGTLIFFITTILFINNGSMMPYLKLPLCLFAGLLILLVYKAQSVLKKVKSIFRITEQLGKYTYGLYVYSGFVISACSQLLHFNNIWLLVSTELIMTILIAAASYHFFESPFLRLKNKFRK